MEQRGRNDEADTVGDAGASSVALESMRETVEDSKHGYHRGDDRDGQSDLERNERAHGKHRDRDSDLGERKLEPRHPDGAARGHGHDEACRHGPDGATAESSGDNT